MSGAAACSADGAAAPAAVEGSLAGFDNLDGMLAAYLPPEQLREARRVLYGARARGRRGGVVRGACQVVLGRLLVLRACSRLRRAPRAPQA